MKVLLTGGAGHVGKATTERLIKHGWDVRVIGLESGVEIPGAEFVTCDIMNYAVLREQMRGCQVVIHLAAVRGPQLAVGPKVFEINVAGTFNVFEAAAAEGIQRVVQASSINALGCAYSLTDIFPKYFPIDEAHASLTSDPYSFSKEIVEDIGRYYWRREGISSVALRFPYVYQRGYVEGEGFYQSRLAMHQMLDELGALLESARQERLAKVRESMLEFRRGRPQEYLQFKEGALERIGKNRHDDPLWFAYVFDRFNFWAFVDARDAAQALEKGATAAYQGAHTLFINDHQNWLGYDARSLVHFFFPGVGDGQIALSGSDALVSIDKARALIGFEPEFSIGKADLLL